MAPAVVFEDVWKKFRRGEHLQVGALRDLIPSLAARVLRGKTLDQSEFWALRDVSFQLEPGEALGVIGPNGAGKSTVLKLLTKILKPDNGRCKVRGRVGTLIEVAAGFHPDLTGTENVFLQGAIMGMRRAEIARKFDEIVEFAGVGDFMDTPVKRYSSGINARLGFSIAAHLDPNVLLIDEVLAVGDMTFQEKCLERMQRFRDQGVAIVFVSHNLQAVAAVCNRVLVLRGGQVFMHGTADEGIAAYAGMSATAAESAMTPGEAFVELRDRRGVSVTSLPAGERATLRVVISPTQVDAPLASAIRIRRIETGEIVYHTTSLSLFCDPVKPLAGDVVEFTWNLTANLARGHYSVEFFAITAATRDIVMRLNPAILFDVAEAQSQSGVAYLDASCEAEAIAPMAQQRVV